VQGSSGNLCSLQVWRHEQTTGACFDVGHTAHDFACLQWYYKLRHGALPCSFPFYEANMRLMLDMVQQQAPSSKVRGPQPLALPFSWLLLLFVPG